MKSLYPSIEPFTNGFLKVSDLHTIYYEVAGNSNGIPVLFLHGGPGGGIEPLYRQFFNPQKYKIILFDQRGCGKSTPHAELVDNTTWDLVGDIEKLRSHLNIESWIIFGGSWGSTLALSYSILHPIKCLALILRGIFLLRKFEIEWFYQFGASNIYPDAWEKYISVIPKSEQKNIVKAFYKRLTSDDKYERLKCAKAWAVWEGSTSKLIPSDKSLHNFDNPKVAEAFSRIECHYFINEGFFKYDGWILDQIDKIRHIHTEIVQGRYDIVCPVKSAWDLHNEFPEAIFHLIKDAGHSMSEPSITSKLIEIMDNLDV
ncbi:MAG: prolyl aminopeptidase [Candidatus Marinimicrobia bacterium]|nr:prolyl aminopeptidase [Candidatus Neomarinimicrobiota bacterium]|tara:strand:- start:5439 stop:6383 length:945 start_codon:yes stop_codon:yes gene_type:complete